MKNIKYILQLFLLAGLGTFLFISCSEDDEPGLPVIDNVRVVEKDSTITAGEFNLVVAIQGKNLGTVQKVLFNDLEAVVNPVYVTNRNILVTIPDQAPNELNNKITLITGSGVTVSSDFVVILPPPVMTGVYNEFAKPGAQNKVLGNYFYFVEKVMVGDQEVEILEVTPREITFTMPEQVGQDQVTVMAEGGTITSTFRLNETEGNMINFDIPATGWGSDVCWGDSERVNPEDSDIEPVAGRYARIKQTDLAATGYQGDWVFSTCWFDFGLSSGSHDEKIFKFESNIVEPWKAGQYFIRITTNDGNLFIYKWKPWDVSEFRTTGIQTNGWRTFYIPLSDFRKTVDDGASFVDPPVRIEDVTKIVDLRVDFNNGGDDAIAIPSHYVAIDNLRIVDK